VTSSVDADRHGVVAGRPVAPTKAASPPARLIALSRRIPPDGRAMLAIAGAVVLANLPYLVGFFDPNPLGPRSGLLSAVTPGLLGGQPTIDPNNGFISQAASHRAVLDWLHFRLPWWNPYEGTGTPLAGGMQSAALFPPTFLTLLANGQLYEHMLLEIIAGVATYLLLRRIPVNRWASAAAGIAFALNGTFAWFSHAPVNPIPFLPLLLLGIELAYAASAAGRRGGWWLIAVAGALSFYAGFPEVAYIDALLAAVWFGWRCGCLPRERLRALAAKAAAGLIVATLLAAPLLIASIDYLGHAELGLHSKGFFGTANLPSEALPQLLLPYVYGPIFRFSDPKLVLPGIWGVVGGYLSTSLLLLGVLGAISKGRRGLRLILLLWIVLVLARMFGEPPLLRDVLGLLPGMSRVAFFRYAPPSLELAVVILAALGLDDLARRGAARQRLAYAALAALAVVAAAAIGARPLANQLGSVFSHRPYYAASVAWGAGIVLAAGATALVLDARARIRLLAVVVAGDALLLFAIPEASAPRSVRTDLAPAAFLQRHLGQSRFFTLGPLQPNYGSYFGIGSLNVNDVPVPSLFADYVRARLDQVVDPTVLVGNLGGGRSPFAPSPRQELLRNLDGYRAAGVTYVLTPAGETLPESPSTFALVFRSPSARIYRLAGAAPYFTATNRSCSVRFGTRESVQLSCRGPTRLIRRETDMPGWSARVDGHPLRLRRVDGLFQAVTVDSGSHRVTFDYGPPNIGLGFAAFAAGCAWLVLAPATARWRRGGRGSPAVG
jgi:hypothetical protein